MRPGRTAGRHRPEAGPSHGELARRSGPHRTYVSLVEQGRSSATVEALAAIAGAVGVRPSRLLAEAEGAGAPDPGHAAAP